jgi:hypothetical protein
MWFTHPAWIPVTWVLAVANLASVWFAAQAGEPWHATVHAALAAGLAIGAQRLQERHRTADRPEQWQDMPHPEHEEQAGDGMQARVEELEERLDFAERLLANQRDADRVGSPRGEPPEAR